MSNQCTHGQLARSCELCERDGEIATLRERLAEVTQQRDDGVRRSEMGVLTTDKPTTTEFAMLRGKVRQMFDECSRERRAKEEALELLAKRHHAAEAAEGKLRRVREKAKAYLNTNRDNPHNALLLSDTATALRAELEKP